MTKYFYLYEKPGGIPNSNLEPIEAENSQAILDDAERIGIKVLSIWDASNPTDLKLVWQAGKPDDG